MTYFDEYRDSNWVEPDPEYPMQGRAFTYPVPGADDFGPPILQVAELRCEECGQNEWKAFTGAQTPRCGYCGSTRMTLYRTDVVDYRDGKTP